MSGSIGAIGLGNPFANFPNRPKITGQFYHFVDDREAQSTVWTQTGTGTETAFSTVTDVVGGEVTATTQSSSPAQGDNVTAIHVAEQFKLSLNAKVFFMARIKWDEVTNSQQFVGICKQATAMLGGAGGTAALSTDVLGAFWSDDGDANIDFIYGKDVATSNANYTHGENAIGTLTADTYKDFAFRITMDKDTARLGLVEAWLDGVKVLEEQYSDLCENEEGALAMGVAVGATTGSATRTYTTDYIGAYQRAA